MAVLVGRKPTTGVNRHSVETKKNLLVVVTVCSSQRWFEKTPEALTLMEASMTSSDLTPSQKPPLELFLIRVMLTMMTKVGIPTILLLLTAKKSARVELSTNGDS